MILSYAIGLHYGWVRIFGYGIAWRDIRHTPMLYTERNRLQTHWHIACWSVHYLSRA